MALIGSLNEDCLLHIFQYLSINDVINLEKSAPEYFEEAAKMYYKKFTSWEWHYRNTTLEEAENILQRLGSYISSFTFSGGYITSENFKNALMNTVLDNCSKLTSLTINYMVLQDHYVYQLGPIVQNLNELDLAHCDIPDEVLACVLLNAKGLKKLNLCGNQYLEGSCLIEMREIEELDVSYCFSLDSIYICFFLQFCKNLKKLIVSGCTRLDCRKVFEELSKHQTNIVEIHAEQLGLDIQHKRLCENLTHLKVLEIDGRKFGT